MTTAVDPPQRPVGDPQRNRGWTRLTAPLARTSPRAILMAACAVLVVGAVGTVGLLSYRAGQEAVTALGEQLLGEIGERIDQRLAASASADPLTREVAGRLLARQPPPGGSEGAAGSAPLTFAFDFAGERWLAWAAPSATPSATALGHPDWLTLVVAPRADFTAPLLAQLRWPALLAALALLATVLLGVLAAGLIGRSLGLERRVAARTAELTTAQAQLRTVLAQVTESEAKFRGMFEQSPLGIALFDASGGRLIQANDRLFRILGRTRQEMDALGWAGITHPDDLPSELAQVARLQAGEIDGFQLEKRYLRPDGSVVWGELSVGSVDLGPAGQRLHLCLVEDIDARKRAEATLAASEARYRLPLDANNDGLWDWDLETGAVIVNDRWFALFDYRPGEVPATIDLWWETLHPEDAAATLRALDDYLQGRAPDYLNDHRVVTRSGEVRWHRSVGKVVARDGQGKPTRMVGTNADITDRVLAEERLKDSLRLLELATRIADIGIGSWDLASGGLEWDARLRAWYEIPEETPVSDLTYEYWMQCIHPDDREFVEASVRAAIRDGTPADGDFRLLLPSGRVRYIHISGIIERDAQGQPCRIIAVSRDVTAQRAQEAALQESEERFRLAFENANTGMCLVDLQGRLLKVNDRMSTFFGYRREEVEGRTVNDFAEPEDRTVSPRYISHAVHGEGDTAIFEKRYRHRDGHLIVGQVAASLVRDAQGQPLYFISQVEDITARKRYEQELEQARESAESANRAKSEFLALMSHEIRTPMNAVLGLTQILNREPLTADQHEMVERIQGAGQSLLGILNDILDLSKIEAGQLHLEPRPFDLDAVLARVAGLMGYAARAKGLGFRVEGPAAPLGPLVGDALRLEQVLTNLVGNAVKFTERGEVTLSVQWVRTEAPSVRLRFEVRDTGIGIPPEARSRLFQPFSQADEGIARRFGGTGLGLAICRRLVAAMDGEIGVESVPSEGSVFRFEVSLAPAVDAAVADESPLRSADLRPSGPRLTGACLLVVDDSAMNRDLLERVLTREGATASLATDGQQAVETLRERGRDFAAVLMDLRMPVMDGLTATRLIRQELGLTDLPVIALTAGATADQREAAQAAGIDDLLVKPLDLEALVDCLLQCLGPRRRPGPTGPAGPIGAAALLDPHPPGAAGAPVPGGAFPEIAGIDRSRAALSTDGDLAFFARLLGRFTDESAGAVAETRQALTVGELEQAARRLHTLRGNAGIIGALAIMTAAAALESAIEQGETDLETRLQALDRQLAELAAASAPWLQSVAAGSAAPVAAGPLDVPALDLDLAGLRDDLYRRNMKARQRFAALRPALAGALGEAKTEALGRAIQGLRYAEALAVLDDPATTVRHPTTDEIEP